MIVNRALFPGRFRKLTFVLSVQFVKMTSNLTPPNVPKEKEDWSVEWPEYKPVDAGGNLANKPWADPEIGTVGFHPHFNQMDGKIDRRSHCGSYLVVDGYPLNPSGRTGLCKRGRLGRWGPNHAADPVVTRWKRSKTTGQIVVDQNTRLPVLSFAAIKRRDTGQWAIPGGMVDPGEKVSTTLRREFLEEALAGLELDSETRKEKEGVIDKFFMTGEEVFKGIVTSDPRNTDNSWMETVVHHIHDETGETVGMLDFKAGDDAAEVSWKDIDSSLSLYADHKNFIHLIVTKMRAHW